MSQVLNIFRKDVRHLSPWIIAVLLLLAANAVLSVLSVPIDIPATARVNSLANMVIVLLPLTMWFLIAQLIFQESLPGDRQFWLTRPYNRWKLFAAKLLFVLTFLSVPLFLSDCLILATQGFPVLSVLPSLLLRQIILTALFIAPSFAIASITTNLAQFVMAWLILVVLFVFETLFPPLILGMGFGMGTVGVDIRNGWSLIFFILAVGGCIAAWQYAKRKTAAARLFAIVMVLATGFSVPALMSWLRQPPAAFEPSPAPIAYRVSYDLGRTPPAEPLPGPVPREDFVTARIPITVEGLPPRSLLRGRGNIRYEWNGLPWPDPTFRFSASVERIGMTYWQSLDFTRTQFDNLKSKRLHLHTEFDFEIVTDQVATVVPFSTRLFLVPGVGRCRTFSNDGLNQFTCRAGLEPRLETEVRLDSTGRDRPALAAFPAESQAWGLSPTADIGGGRATGLHPNSRLEFTPRRRIAAFRQTIDVQNILLTDYVAPR